MSEVSKPHSELVAISQAHPRVLPIYRKSGSHVEGADAFERARDIETVMDALPGLLEQKEAGDKWRSDSIARAEQRLSEATDERDRQYWIGYKHALVDENVLAMFPPSNPAKSEQAGGVTPEGGEAGTSERPPADSSPAKRLDS